MGTPADSIQTVKKKTEKCLQKSKPGQVNTQRDNRHIYLNYYIFLNSSSFEYIIVNYFIISLAILKDQPDFVHISHVVDTHMSGLSVTEGRRPELIASNGAFHINKTHPYIHAIS